MCEVRRNGGLEDWAWEALGRLVDCQTKGKMDGELDITVARTAAAGVGY